jgi:hypothetical protein
MIIGPSDINEDEGDFLLLNKVRVAKTETRCKNIVLDVRPGPLQAFGDISKRSLVDELGADELLIQVPSPESIPSAFQMKMILCNRKIFTSRIPK